jgi:dienelactone hydrolase
MENIKVLKRFVRNATIMAVVAAVCFYGTQLSAEYLNNPVYPMLALFSGMLVWLLWGISQSQLESEAREKRDATTLME